MVSPYVIPGIKTLDLPSVEIYWQERLLDYCSKVETFKFIKDWNQISLAGRTNRKRQVVQIRQMYHYLMKRDTSLSLQQIGELTGGHDHTTVIHSNKKVKGFLDTKDPITTHLFDFLHNNTLKQDLTNVARDPL